MYRICWWFSRVCITKNWFPSRIDTEEWRTACCLDTSLGCHLTPALTADWCWSPPVQSSQEGPGDQCWGVESGLAGIRSFKRFWRRDEVENEPGGCQLCGILVKLEDVLCCLSTPSWSEVLWLNWAFRHHSWRTQLCLNPACQLLNIAEDGAVGEPKPYVNPARKWCCCPEAQEHQFTVHPPSWKNVYEQRITWWKIKLNVICQI